MACAERSSQIQMSRPAERGRSILFVAAQAGFAERMAEGAQGGVAGKGGAGLLLGGGEFGGRRIAVEIHGVENAPEIGGQVDAGEVFAALGGGGIGRLLRAVEVEEEDAPRGGGAGGVAPQADVLVAEVVMEHAGIVQGADGVGDALQEVHERGAAGRAGIEAVQFVAEAGQVGHEGGDEEAFAEAGAFPALGDGDGGRGADAGGAQGEGVFGRRAGLCCRCVRRRRSRQAD